MKYIKQYSTLEDHDYFYPGDDKFCVRKYDNKIFFIVSYTEFLALGKIITYSEKRSVYSYIDWDVDDNISLPHKMTLSKINSDLELIIRTIPDDIIQKIEQITNSNISGYIRKKKSEYKRKEFNI